MKRKDFTESPIVSALKQQEGGIFLSPVCYESKNPEIRATKRGLW